MMTIDPLHGSHSNVLVPLAEGRQVVRSSIKAQHAASDVQPCSGFGQEMQAMLERTHLWTSLP